jgi:hypothetical protein
MVSNKSYNSDLDIYEVNDKNPLSTSIVRGSAGVNTSSGTLIGILFLNLA